MAAFANKKEAIKYGDELTVSMQGYDVTVEEKWHGGWVVTHKNGQEMFCESLSTDVINIYSAFNGPNESSLDDEGHHVDDDSDDDEDTEKDDDEAEKDGHDMYTN